MKCRQSRRTNAEMRAEMKVDMELGVAKMKTKQGRLRAKIKVNNEKFDFLRESMWISLDEMKTRIHVLVFRMDIQQARTEAIQERKKDKVKRIKKRPW
jgi:hypothetical protein